MPTGTQLYGLTPQRIGKFKGQILKHAEPMEILSKQGRQIRMPKNESDTYVTRRWLPWNATSADQNTQNRFFTDGTGDRANVLVQAHQTAEGVTRAPETILKVDITTVMIQYDCLYSLTDKTVGLYEDDIPKEMIKLVGERVTLINELIIWGQLRAGTNQFYAGSGTSQATVDSGLTLGFIRKITKNLQANHAKMVTSMLKASRDYATDPVSSGYFVYTHTDIEPDIRDLPGYTPVEKYASGTPVPYEVGKCERFRFVTCPDFPPVQDAGAAIGSTGLFSTTGTSIDVYQAIITAQDAWGQISVRGLDSLMPTYLPPNMMDKSDPLGQRGYIGTKWWKGIQRENDGWMAIANFGSKILT